MNWLLDLIFGILDRSAQRQAQADEKRRQEIEASDKAIREELEAAEQRRKQAN